MASQQARLVRVARRTALPALAIVGTIAATVWLFSETGERLHAAAFAVQAEQPETSPDAPTAPSPTGDALKAERQPFHVWLEGVRAEALARGIRQTTVDQALAINEPLAVVVERDRSQTESTLPLETYVTRRVTARVARTGRAMADHYQEVLARVEQEFGVPGRVAVAVWGLESNFGRFSGTRPTVAALATLAWDPRRSALFRNELFDALTIVDQGDVDLTRMRGSWAGAMGQAQFMPSSYLRYARDFDGDGRRDIWTSVPDVLASIANYLRERGWAPGESWGQEVSVPPDRRAALADQVPRRTNGCRAVRELTEPVTLDRWRELGVRRRNGRPLGGGDSLRSLVSGSTKSYLVSANYEALLEYNCAHAYALSVAILSDRIGQAPRQPTAGGRAPAEAQARVMRSRGPRPTAPNGSQLER